MTIILKHIDSDFLKIDIFKKYLDDQKVEFYDNLSFIELSIGSNNDRYFSTLKQSMDDYFGTPQNGKTEEGYDNVFFNYKISYMTDYVLIKLRRFIKNNTITTHIWQPLKIPTMINFRNYMMKEEETIYKIKAIIFYQKSRKTAGHFVDLIYIKKNWVLFNNEKVSFPEYQKKHINILNDAIKTGAYLLLYKKTEKHQFVNEIFCLHHKGINSSEQIQQDEINSSEQINPLNSETEPNFIVVRHGGVYENTFILSSMFDDLLGILSVNPVGAPESPIGEFEMSNTLFGIFIRTISKQLANKVFLKNDVGQDNLDLINRKLFDEIQEDDNVNLVELDSIFNGLYAECVVDGKVDSAMIKRSIDSIKNLSTLPEGDGDEDIFNDQFFTFENYRWRDRASALAIDKTVRELLEIMRKNKSKSHKTCKSVKEKEEKRQAKQIEYNKVHYAFIDRLKKLESQPGMHVNCNRFCHEFHSARVNGSFNDCVPTYFTLRDWFYDYHHKKPFNSIDVKQGGRRENHVKINNDVIECLICTLLDFPTWTLRQRTAYINGMHGATEKEIKVSTIEKAVKFMNFTIHKTRYSPPARNSIGLRALRITWAKYVSQMIQNGSSCFIFVDEAGLSLFPRSSMCRGFVGVTPLTLRNLQFSRISVVAAVIPGFGVIYQWSDGKSIKNNQYQKFLREVVNVIRRFIGTGKTKIVLIHDNASIHWTNNVLNVINDEKIELLPTVPYSPQINYLAECYFAITKASLANIDVPPIVDDNVVEMIKYKWDILTRNHFNGEVTAKMFSEWEAILDDCCKGLPLGHEGHHPTKIDRLNVLRGFQTFRCGELI